MFLQNKSEHNRILCSVVSDVALHGIKMATPATPTTEKRPVQQVSWHSRDFIISIWVLFSSKASSRLTSIQEQTFGEQLFLLSLQEYSLSSDTLPGQGNSGFKLEEQEVLIPGMVTRVLPHRQLHALLVTSQITP